MARSPFFLFAFLLPVVVCAQYEVTFRIAELPPNHDNTSALYLAGSFNNWNPQNEQFKFQQDEKGHYFLNLKLNEGAYEYKVTRGGWDKVECSKQGAAINNRALKIEVGAIILIEIEGWQDKFSPQPKHSSASPQVKIIQTAFFMPQLNRTRRIWIYLPEGYNQSKNRYPVLYMHDGQNVFEDTSSFSGEWGLDEFLDSTTLKTSIVVGIDNSQDKRMNEYNPYDHTRFGKGEGDAYVDFIVKTLKPNIDQHYRTRKNKANTFIAGSSMGGLISMYAVMKYPKVFGGAGVFSPAFWTAPAIFDAVKKKAKKINSNIFFFAGKLEGEQMITDMLRAFEYLAAKSKSKMKTVIRDEGRHNEATWRKEFPAGYAWMIGSE